MGLYDWYQITTDKKTEKGEPISLYVRAVTAADAMEFAKTTGFTLRSGPLLQAMDNYTMEKFYKLKYDSPISHHWYLADLEPFDERT